MLLFTTIYNTNHIIILLFILLLLLLRLLLTAGVIALSRPQPSAPEPRETERPSVFLFDVSFLCVLSFSYEYFVFLCQLLYCYYVNFCISFAMSTLILVMFCYVMSTVVLCVYFLCCFVR